MALPENPITRKEAYLAKIAGQEVQIPDVPITREEAYLDEIAKNGGGGGGYVLPTATAKRLGGVKIGSGINVEEDGTISASGGGTTDYDDLNNKPSINDVELSGNKIASDLGLQGALTFDNVPTDGSNNPVKSGGVYSAEEAIRQWTTASAKSVSGNPITLTDGSARNAEGLVVTLEPIQSGSGTPSPENVRPITGYTECVVDVKDEEETTQDTATITFGQTVYGGSVNFKTGKVTVTHAVKDMGDIDWLHTDVNNVMYVMNIDGKAVGRGNFICDSYRVVDTIYQNLENGQMTGAETVSAINVRDDRYTDPSAFKTAIRGHYICFPLATPIELTLTPAELELLKGYNYITTNGTTIALAYLPDSLLAEVENYVDAKIPPAPSSDGTYVLTCTVTDGTPAYSWESAT